MFTKKSLIVGIVLVLSVLCAGTMGAFASSVTPTTPLHYTTNPFLINGIAAIPTTNNDDILEAVVVERYLKNQGFIAGPTVNGKAPVIQKLKLTTLAELKKLINLAIPGMLGNRQVYYSQIKGPFLVRPDLPLPIISTLFPSANNMVVLGHLPLLNELSNLGGLPALQNLTNKVPTDDLLNNLPILSNLTRADILNDLKDLANEFGSNRINSSPGVGIGPSLERVFEVFDAHTGNLLAWG